MHRFAKPLLVAVALVGINLAAAQSPPNQGAPGGSTQPALGTGSCSGALGAEPGCSRPQRGSSAEQSGNAGAEDNDQVGSHTPSTDRMGPNAVSRGGGGTGQSGSGGSGADGLGGGQSGR
jgi:hypothetical protein